MATVTIMGITLLIPKVIPIVSEDVGTLLKNTAPKYAVRYPSSALENSNIKKLTVKIIKVVTIEAAALLIIRTTIFISNSFFRFTNPWILK